MWLIGDWGQADPWTRASGVQMVKGEDGLYTGVLTLPKGTRFDLKILKNPTVGTLIWSATRYTSVLNSDGAYDFGEFVDNLVPNGNFEEVAAKWTPSESIVERAHAHEGGHCLTVGDKFADTASSDTFVIPPNQSLRYSTYIRTWAASKLARVVIKDVDTQSVLLESLLKIQPSNQWIAFSGTFKSGNYPVKAQVVCTSVDKVALVFDSMSIVSP